MTRALVFFPHAFSCISSYCVYTYPRRRKSHGDTFFFAQHKIHSNTDPRSVDLDRQCMSIILNVPSVLSLARFPFVDAIANCQLSFVRCAPLNITNALDRSIDQSKWGNFSFWLVNWMLRTFVTPNGLHPWFCCSIVKCYVAGPVMAVYSKVQRSMTHCCSNSFLIYFS